MKTLTIAEGKKNLNRRLQAAARGEDIGIIHGANIVALRKVEFESTDYAERVYDETPKQLAVVLEKATERRYRRLKRDKRLALMSEQDIRKALR